MPDREAFVVDTSSVERARAREVWGFALELVGHDATRFETDLPLSQSAGWPAPVLRAAQRLSRHATGRRGRNDDYRSTGLVSVRDGEDWEALVCFAPYAFDATVWAADGELASMSDEGTSLVMHLDADQRAQLEGFEAGVRVVPLRVWRRRSPARGFEGG